MDVKINIAEYDIHRADISGQPNLSVDMVIIIIGEESSDFDIYLELAKSLFNKGCRYFVFQGLRAEVLHDLVDDSILEMNSNSPFITSYITAGDLSEISDEALAHWVFLEQQENVQILLTGQHQQKAFSFLVGVFEDAAKDYNFSFAHQTNVLIRSMSPE